jgi:AcrR family transcriptional regulator
MPIASTRFELPLAGPVEERRDAAANRQRILTAARRLIAEGGPSALSMDAVAAAAGVGKGTIFRRFGDRAGLTGALLDEYMRGFQDAFLSGPPPLGPGAAPAERLEAFLIALVHLHHENLAVAMAGEERHLRGPSTVYGALHLHVRLLIESLDPRLHSGVLATMLLATVSPPHLDQLLRERGEQVEAVTASVSALLAGLLRAS